jgi:hypothetical protein
MLSGYWGNSNEFLEAFYTEDVATVQTTYITAVRFYQESGRDFNIPRLRPLVSSLCLLI